MFGEAQSAHRMEDRRFLRGAGRYLDDVQPAGCAAMYILRSPHAHAAITDIDVSAALDAPGVRAVFTARDLGALGLGPMPCLAEVRNWKETPSFLPARPVLAGERVRYAGEAVAAIVADTVHQARDAAELIAVEYDALPATATIGEALAASDPLWEEAPGNFCFDWSYGDKDAVNEAFRGAARVVSVTLENNRVAGMSLEPRGAIGDYDRHDERFVLHVSSQGGHAIRRILCQNLMNIPESRMRVITPDVGGGFGPKIFAYPEYALALVAARRIGRPVKWVAERMESLQSDTQGRGQRTVAELAMDAGGRFLAMRFDTFADLGAYPAQHGPNIATVAGAGIHPSVYRIDAVSVRVRGVFTNTVPVDSYRGAGRPEVIYAVERLVDAAARETGIDPAELRRRNFIARADMPFSTVSGQTYDDGDFVGLLDKAVDMSGYGERERFRAEARARGKLGGVGLAYFLDRCGRGLDEYAEIRFDPSGSAVLFVGSQTNGQGHETAYAEVASRVLGIPRDELRVVQGDTDQVAFGRGTGGSRALAVGGNSVHLAAGKIVEKARRIAAHMAGVDIEAVSFEDGWFRIAGSNRTIALRDCARTAFDPRLLPAGMEPGMSASGSFTPPNPTFPNGCHVCWVEIDPRTGAVELKRYMAVNDFGTILNRKLVDGQLQGGLAQGAGQALLEQVVYEEGSAQLVTGSLMDYCYPKSDDFPDFELHYVEIPCRSNPLGVKGCGEAGAIAAPPTIANAVMDALSAFDTSDLQMPFTSGRVFSVLSQGPRAAGKGEVRG